MRLLDGVQSFRDRSAMIVSLMAYRSSSLRIELNVQDVFMVANETRSHQQSLEDRLTAELDKDRRAQDQFSAQVLAQLENLQLQHRETQHHRTDVQRKPVALLNSTLHLGQCNEHAESDTQVQQSLTVPEHSFLRSDALAHHVDHWNNIGVRASLGNISECTRSCGCSCHIRRRLNTPRLLDGFLGSLFIGYSGSPILNQKCDQTSCRGRKA